MYNKGVLNFNPLQNERAVITTNIVVTIVVATANFTLSINAVTAALLLKNLAYHFVLNPVNGKLNPDPSLNENTITEIIGAYMNNNINPK